MPVVALHARPFSADGADVGMVLFHGFTGSPAAVRPWAEHLASQGFTVRAPRLPGHGTCWQQLNRTRWQDWYAAADRSFQELRARCSRVVVGGLSLGGALALRVAQQHGRDVAGLVLVNPFVQVADKRLHAVPLVHHFVPSLKGIANDVKKPGVDEHAYPRTPLHALNSLLSLGSLVCADLPKVTQPLLVLRSAEDHVVDPLSCRLLAQRVSSRDMSELLLGDSYHVATLDNDAGTVFAESAKFVERVTAEAG
ncbi:MAG TPA: alpha/beta fold hydrolase [Nocardioidaceae bacterium]|nr:alpha/beta fold hydrolase [Nocardioidaceae bacterium]